MDTILLDFSKNFDDVPHQRLLSETPLLKRRDLCDSPEDTSSHTQITPRPEQTKTSCHICHWRLQVERTKEHVSKFPNAALGVAGSETSCSQICYVPRLRHQHCRHVLQSGSQGDSRKREACLNYQHISAKLDLFKYMFLPRTISQWNSQPNTTKWTIYQATLI